MSVAGVAMRTTPRWDVASRGTSQGLWVGVTAPCGLGRAWGCLWPSLPAGHMLAVQTWMSVAWAWRGATCERRA